MQEEEVFSNAVREYLCIYNKPDNRLLGLQISSTGQRMVLQELTLISEQYFKIRERSLVYRKKICSYQKRNDFDEFNLSTLLIR